MPSARPGISTDQENREREGMKGEEIAAREQQLPAICGNKRREMKENEEHEDSPGRFGFGSRQDGSFPREKRIW